MAPNQTDRIATLDLLRLVSALAVVVYHYFFRGAAADGYLAVSYPEAAPYAIYGYLGLNLFFMISGFVIAWSAEGRDPASFALARFARLYPGFVACMTITFAVIVLFGMPPFSTGPAQYVANLVMFAPALGQPFMDGVYWTIILEIVFYGWVALALLAGVFQRWKLPLLAGWLAVAMINEFVIGSGALRMLFVTEYAPFFVFGVLVHHMSAHGRSREALVLAAVATVFSMSTVQVLREWMLEHYGTALSLPALLVANAAIQLILLGAVALRHRLPSSGVVIMLGGLTYPLYLLHQHVGYIAINRLAPVTGRWAAALLALAAILVVSGLIWRFVERPARRAIMGAGRKLIARLPERLTRPAVMSEQ